MISNKLRIGMDGTCSETDLKNATKTRAISIELKQNIQIIQQKELNEQTNNMKKKNSSRK